MRSASIRPYTALSPQVGMKATLNQCLALVDEMEANATEMPWYPKHAIVRDFFTKATTPDWDRFPPHTRLGIDVKGHKSASAEYRLLEASLFESAALLWNDTVAAEEHKRGSHSDDKVRVVNYARFH